MPDDKLTNGHGQPGRLGGDLPFQQLLEHLPAGAYTCDPEGRITYFNKQAEEIWGRAPKLNDPVDRFCGSFKLFAIDGAPLPHAECWTALALRTGEAFNGQEILIERQDGSRIFALAHANPLFDDAKTLIGAVNVLVDITDHRRDEAATAQLAAIVESSEDAIVSKTLEGRILSWNTGAERLFGYRAHEAIGAPITLIIPPEKRHEEGYILSKLRQGERIEHFDTVRVTKDGRRIDISLTVSPVRDRAGRIIGASKIARDITFRKQAEQSLAILHDRLREADRVKDEFLATLAHELRNPLAPLTNALNILRISEDLSPGVETLREIMERQVHHLTRLVDELLEVSRITRGKIELRKEPVELAAIIRGALETSRPLIESAGHQLAICIDPEPLTLQADPVRLTQVISNLLNNAAKYTENGGQLWLSVKRKGDEAIVSVRDNGLGIPAEMLPRVFEMFTQVDRTLQRAQGGLGIGLSLARRLVEMHGGRIDALSRGQGQGSEFVVSLPLAGTTQQEPHDSPPRSRAVQLPARQILIVDDSRAAAYTLGKLLESLGQTVRTACDGATALDSVRSAPPDVVISDIGMPNMSGLELARRLRDESGLHDVVLVALTGYGQESDRQRSIAAGFDYHLVKPVSLDALQSLLASLPDRAVSSGLSAGK